MADIKISQLPVYPGGATPALTDILPIVDIAASTTRQVPFSKFVSVGVSSLAVNPMGTTRTGALRFLAGTNVSLTDNNDGTFTINAMGGGGGGTFMTTAIWTGGTSSKNAFTSPGVINNQGITVNLVASSGSGQITGITVTLNTVALSGTYATTGTWPNLVLTIPVADITGNAAQTAASVQISITGTFGGSGVNIPNAGTLTNVQPSPFAASLSAAFSPNPIAFYQATGTVNFAYNVTGTATTYAGTIAGTATGNVASGSLTSFATPTAASPIAGTVTGDGRFGAATGATVNLSGSMPAPSMYTPAFYAQTDNNTPPTFTTASTQTAGAATGSTITYPAATATTQYNWIATTRPVSAIFLQTPFGNAPLVPDVIAAAQTISSVSFNVFGFTSLTVGAATVLIIQ